MLHPPGESSAELSTDSQHQLAALLVSPLGCSADPNLQLTLGQATIGWQPHEGSQGTAS